MLNWFMFISSTLVAVVALTLACNGLFFGSGLFWDVIGAAGIYLCSVSAGLWLSNIVRGE